MASLDDGGVGNRESAPLDQECDAATASNARVGLILFTIYLGIYCGYVGLTAFAPAIIKATPIAGLNVATLYGMGLIVLALVFAVAYGWACRAPTPTAPSDGARESRHQTSDGSPMQRSGRDG